MGSAVVVQGHSGGRGRCLHDRRRQSGHIGRILRCMRGHISNGIVVCVDICRSWKRNKNKNGAGGRRNVIGVLQVLIRSVLRPCGWMIVRMYMVHLRVRIFV